MGKLIIVNGSPRAPRSNSKKYAEIFQSYWGEPVREYLVTDQRHAAVCGEIGQYEHLLLVSPLYADSLPVTCMRFLKTLEQNPPAQKPTVHLLINCGFLEPEQNQVAVDIVRLFCKKNGYPYGMTLCIGSGEAILSTPFSFLVKRKINRMAKEIRRGKQVQLQAAMPLSKKIFINASTKYWIRCGEKNRVGKKQMETMKIEGK